MNIIIIGGVAAGSKAAAKIKRLLPNASVTIYTDDTNVSYSSCGNLKNQEYKYFYNIRLLV